MGVDNSDLLIIPTRRSSDLDLAIYKTPFPEEENFWPVWVPEIVIEVVSPGSEHRDYEEKREEYLLFGVRIDRTHVWTRHANGLLLRSGDHWKKRTIRPPRLY